MSVIFVMLGIELWAFCEMGGAAVRSLTCHTYVVRSADPGVSADENEMLFVFARC